MNFLAVGGVVAAAAGVPAIARAAAPDFDRSGFEETVRAPFTHRQAFASPLVADGAVLGFMANSLNAYETGFGEGPGTLHAAAVLYHLGVAVALDDAAWRTFAIADGLRRDGDRVTAAAADGNPFLRQPRGRTIDELQRRHASFFVCRNALVDLARKSGTTLDSLTTHLLPGMTIVPAGVAALNALQEEHFTFFAAAS